MSDYSQVLNEILAVLKSIDERLENSFNYSPSIKKKQIHSSNFQKGLRFAEVRALVLSLRKQGRTFNQITQAVRDRWPDSPEKHVTRAAIHRFWDNARSGRLKEFGININL